MITDVYFPRVNGVSTSIQTFSADLQALGHDVALVAPGYGRSSLDVAGVFRVPSVPIPLDPEDRLMRWRRLQGLLQELAKDTFDLVHIQTPFLAHYAGVRFAEALRLPRVETYHTFFEEYFFHYVRFLPRRMLKALARRFSRSQCNDVDGLIVPSSQMREVLESYGIKAPMEVIPTGIAMEDFAGGDGPGFRERKGIPRDRPLVAFVGRVAFEKNIDFLLRMTARLKLDIPNILFVISGEGPALGALKERAHELSLADNVSFVGYLDRRTALLDCYRAADVFVFASRTETQGLVLLESMAVGTPVVSTAELGTRDVLRQGEGAVIVPEDEDEFAAAVAVLLKDKARRQDLGRAGERYARQWSARAMAERLATFYARVASARFLSKTTDRQRSL